MNTHLFKKSVISMSILFVSISANGGTVLTDGDFSNWQVDYSFSGGSATRIPNGGNPGAFFSLTASSALASVLTSNPIFGYSPATDGAILSLNFQADVVGISDLLDTTGDTVPQFAFTVIQNGDVYWHAIAFNSANWTNIGTADLSASDFTSPFTAGVPDFSTNGSPITFGIAAATDFASGMEFGVDNYQVSINSVPIPPALFLFSTGLIVLSCVTEKTRWIYGKRC